MREGGLLLQNPIPLTPPNELEGKVDRICHYDFEDAKLVNSCSRGSLVDDKGEEEAPLYNLFLRKKGILKNTVNFSF